MNKKAAESLRERLSKYSLAATAALLAGGSTAEADLILYDNGGAGWTFGPGIGSFNLGGAVNTGSVSVGGDFEIRNDTSTVHRLLVPRDANLIGYLRLASGVPVNASNSFARSAWMSYYGGGSAGWSVSGGPSSSGYVGLRFDDGAGTVNYGWAEITLSNPSPTQTVTLNRYVVETTPDQGVITGVVPEPSTLSLLALGAIGLAQFRRKKSA